MEENVLVRLWRKGGREECMGLKKERVDKGGELEGENRELWVEVRKAGMSL